VFQLIDLPLEFVFSYCLNLSNEKSFFLEFITIYFALAALGSDCWKVIT
jgi:hypothetical protein